MIFITYSMLDPDWASGMSNNMLLNPCWIQTGHLECQYLILKVGHCVEKYVYVTLHSLTFNGYMHADSGPYMR